MCTIMSAISTWFFHKVGMDIFYFINCFFVYSFLGWIFECIVISYEEKAPVNRGFIRGPFCTIYGVGALGTYFLFLPISHNKVLPYSCCTDAKVHKWLFTDSCSMIPRMEARFIPISSQVI